MKLKLDWKEYENTARQAVAEGVVLLKNEKQVLPLAEGTKLAVFGRMQNHYYKSGTGSGGMVNVRKVWGLLDALKEERVTLDATLLKLYEEFDETHPYVEGVGFGQEPWSQQEMDIDMEVVMEAAAVNDTALVIIARTAGEEQDYTDEPGSYRLTDEERGLLNKVRMAFNRMVVVLNVSAILDMSDIEAVAPDAILYAWQGGEMGGLGTADVLMGHVSPSGRLTDTIARSITDYPAAPNFGDTEKNYYVEDIYVGYRYFETFDKQSVLYPFGFGLSYTDFRIETLSQSFEDMEDELLAGVMELSVTNTGEYPGKEVVQIYVSAPQGVLGQPALRLVAYEKTDLLKPGQSQHLRIRIAPERYAAYDDSGATGFPHAYVLEAGAYHFFAGKNVRELIPVAGFELAQTKVVQQLSQAMAPTRRFNRMRPVYADGIYHVGLEEVPMAKEREEQHRAEHLPKDLRYTGNFGIKLADVLSGHASMDQFIGQLSDEDLSCIIRGEGMGSPKVTPGTAAAFGGVSPSLKALGIPCGCCSDGPSGMRLDCGTRAFSLPNGTLLACTFNQELNQELYHYLGLEMTKNRVDVLLGPGMNLHRFPLNGRNFEYFSEDPLVTGLTAAAQLRGLHTAGVTGTCKHFCGNNQEKNRHGADAVISERALRELYLKGFEIAVKEGGADSVMTTYGPVNGRWTNSRYDLNTTILRQEWGFKGIVMTDWWANIGDVGGKVTKNDFAALVRAQNDFYAVCPDASQNTTGDNTLQALAAGEITRGELQRNAANICGFLMHTNAMKRMMGEAVEIVLENYEDEEEQFSSEDVVYYEIQDGTVIPLEHVEGKKGSSYVFGVDVLKRGVYKLEITGRSDLSALSQTPVSIFFQSIPGGTFIWNGTGGEWVTMERKIIFVNRYGVIRLYFAGAGVQLRDIRLTYELDLEHAGDRSEYIYG
jgi:beta-glucosidase